MKIKKVCYSYGITYHSKYILDRIYLLYINIIVIKRKGKKRMLEIMVDIAWIAVCVAVIVKVWKEMKK